MWFNLCSRCIVQPHLCSNYKREDHARKSPEILSNEKRASREGRFGTGASVAEPKNQIEARLTGKPGCGCLGIRV